MARRPHPLSVLFALACALAAAAPAQAQLPTPERPFDFRGFYVGMSLEQFRRMPPPLPAVGQPRAACPKIIDPDDAQRSVVRCVWRKSLPDGRQVQAQLMLGDTPTRDYGFVFYATAGSPELRLQRIVLSLPVKGRARVFKRLTEKFGDPQRPEVDDDVWWAQWQNGGGTVSLRSSVGDGSTLVTFRLGHGGR